ncbi:MAG TPA: branched-chain amino acid ABC transporter permease [Firmicutes bacterium]|jgi:branched-chain amino acid transport system permease protein|nr:branched-chain amino acid ABC transporter permease [Bacillota bacterium]HBR28661.1 branched-chain amino acid ABC transporter permease [Bacillota bacterium]
MDYLQQFCQQTLNGMSLGSIYALLALGYTMVYGIVKLINFAHGDILMVGAFVSYFFLRRWGITPVTLMLSFLPAMLFCLTLGVLIEKICYKPLRDQPRINTLITAIGVSFFLENGARVIPGIGPNPRVFPTLSAVNYTLLGVNISQVQILVFIVAIILMVLLNYIVSFTKIGKAMRAVSFDKGAAYLMGINVDRVISFTFVLGSSLAAAAGILFASSYPQIEPYMGTMPGMKAFIAAVLGGIGSIPGAVLGGFILGVAETLAKGFLSSQLSDAIAFGLLIIILVVKPSGLLGKPMGEKV